MTEALLVLVSVAALMSIWLDSRARRAQRELHVLLVKRLVEYAGRLADCDPDEQMRRAALDYYRHAKKMLAEIEGER